MVVLMYYIKIIYITNRHIVEMIKLDKYQIVGNIFKYLINLIKCS